uniref:uncharacterized protein LOC129123364 n=1 Tax=Agelaius phoeniceus TaxID=39638 RepID=UPI0023EB9430|nr:uncharacterized protein LOC129123364 [Agelaius phoeniceus]
MAGTPPTVPGAPSPSVQPGLGHCQGSRGSPSCSGHLCQGCPPCQGTIPNSQSPIQPCPLALAAIPWLLSLPFPKKATMEDLVFEAAVDRKARWSLLCAGGCGEFSSALCKSVSAIAAEPGLLFSGKTRWERAPYTCRGQSSPGLGDSNSLPHLNREAALHTAFLKWIFRAGMSWAGRSLPAPTRLAFRGPAGRGEAEWCSWLWQQPGMYRTSCPAGTWLFVTVLLGKILQSGRKVWGCGFGGCAVVGGEPFPALSLQQQSGVTILSTASAPESTLKCRLWDGSAGTGGAAAWLWVGLCPLHYPLPTLIVEP